MERDKLARLAQALAGRTTRRHCGRLFLALGIGAGCGLNRFDAAETDAKHKKGKKRKKKRTAASPLAGASPLANASSPPAPPCVPDCTGKVCGPDGCGGICGKCGLYEPCVDGVCEPVDLCIGSCNGKDCGPRCDGGPPDECGVCQDGWTCHAGGACLL